MNYLVSVQGKDRKGLVEALALAIEERGGNWQESRLCRLGGWFAGIISVNFPETPEALPDRVSTLECRWQSLEDEEAPTGATTRASLSFVAADRPGLVKQISHILTSNGANVEEIESRVFSAPFSGEQMFEARYLITLDESCDRPAINRQLESLAEELTCDVDFEEKLV